MSLLAFPRVQRQAAGRRHGARLAQLLVAVAAVGLMAAAPAHAQQRVQFLSLDGPATAPVVLSGLFLRSAPVVGARRGAVLMLHGCDGLWRDESRATLQARYLDYARLFNDEGWHVLLVDSLSPRGVHETCSQKIAARSVRQAHRRRDALAALQWLAAQDGVDAARLAVVGWSHGGSAALSAINLRHAEVNAAVQRARTAVAYYPSCDNELRMGFEPAAPLLMLLGEDDDWHPPQPCRELAQRVAGMAAASGTAVPATVTVHTYAGARHEFDTQSPVRLRNDVVDERPGSKGVHAGGDAAARADSRRRLLEFLREQLR